MSASYTTSLRLTLQGDGDNPSTWGDVTNTQVIQLIESAIAGVATVDCSGSSDVNIATSTQNGAADTARNAVLQLTGVLTGSINFIVPSVPKLYAINGLWSGAYTITIKPTGGSGGIALSTGQLVLVYVTGTNIYEVSTSSPLGALLSSNNLSDVASAATARINLGLGSIATQPSNNVSITGGSITGVTGLSAVTSVAGRTGAVVLANTDISGLGSLSTQNSGSVSITGGTITGIPTSTLGTPTAFNSSTSYNVTGLPTGITELRMNLQGVTLSGASQPLFQIGDNSGGLKTSGYHSTSTAGGAGGGSNALAQVTTGMGAGSSIVVSVASGSIFFNLVDPTNFSWVATYGFFDTSGGHWSGGGQVTLSGPLDRVTFTTVAGTATWTAGNINILYHI